MLQLGKFPTLSNKALQEAIASVAREASFDAQEVLMDYGQYISHMPLLISGSIKILREDVDGREILLYHVQPGGTCAVSLACCMERRQSEIRAITESPTKVLMIPIEHMEPWMATHSGWRQFVIQTYHNRFSELLKTVDDIAFRKLDERLLLYLQKRAALAEDGVVRSTHQEIAQDLNGSRESISRLLKQLERMGRIQLSRNAITINA